MRNVFFRLPATPAWTVFFSSLNRSGVYALHGLERYGHGFGPQCRPVLTRVTLMTMFSTTVAAAGAETQVGGGQRQMPVSASTSCDVARPWWW